MAKLRIESLCSAACALMLLGALAASSGVALAEEDQALPPAKKPRFPNRYDFMWRTPPLPHYIVAMSRDDPLCDSIAKAFNAASTPKGAPPGSLYKDSMFVKWEHNPRSLPPAQPDTDVDVTTADPFNEGRKHPIAQFRLAQSTTMPRFYTLSVCEYEDESELSSASWKTIEDMGRLPACHIVWPAALYNLQTKGNVVLPTFSPDDLNKLYPEARNRMDFRWPAQFSNGAEINFISRGGTQLIVLRNPLTEVTLVTQFTSRNAPPKNICLIGPEVPVEVHWIVTPVQSE